MTIRRKPQVAGCHLEVDISLTLLRLIRNVEQIEDFSAWNHMELVVTTFDKSLDEVALGCDF